MCQINELIWSCGCVQARNVVYRCQAAIDKEPCHTQPSFDRVDFPCIAHGGLTTRNWDYPTAMREIETEWWEDQLAEEETARANAEVVASSPPSPYLAPLPAQVQAQEVEEGDEEMEASQPPNEEAASIEGDPSGQNENLSRSSPQSVHTPEHQITRSSSDSSNQESQQLLQELHDAAVLNARQAKRPSRGWAYIDEDEEVLKPTESEIFEQIVKQNSGGERKRKRL